MHSGRRSTRTACTGACRDAAASEQSVQLAEELEQQPEQPMQKPEQAVAQSLQPEQTKQAFPILSHSAPPHASAVMLPYLCSFKLHITNSPVSTCGAGPIQFAGASRSAEKPSISATSSSFKSLVMSRYVCVCVCVCVRACERASVLVFFSEYLCVRVTDRHMRAHTHLQSQCHRPCHQENYDEIGLQVPVLAALLTPLRKDHQTR